MTALAARSRCRADELYGRLLATAAGGVPTSADVRLADGRLERLQLERWLAPADPADVAALAGARAPVLDIGCGPGRHLSALTAAGVRALGVDLSPVAVALARGRGGDAVPGSVFARVPDAGGWRTALLLDGNIGIGGAPSALLRRAGELLAPDGRVVVEVDPPGTPTFRTRIRIEAPDAVSEWFAWARVGADGIAAVARGAEMRVAGRLVAGGRTFVTLERA
jgi:SAM-dependent methyltransferase